MKLVVMRHGQTDYNREHRYTGTTDLPLNDTGIQQARDAGQAPSVKLAFVSPLSRARQTARLCFPNAEQRIVEGLREIDFGAFEGKNADDMKNDESYLSWHASEWRLAPPGGQSRGEHQCIVLAATERIIQEQEAAEAPFALIVAHGGVAMAIFDALVPEEQKEGRRYFDWNPGNCGLFSADVSHTEDGQLQLLNPQHHTRVDFLEQL